MLTRVDQVTSKSWRRRERTQGRGRVHGGSLTVIVQVDRSTVTIWTVLSVNREAAR